jgi:hypothetical protein
MPQWAVRRDETEEAIVDALRRFGCKVRVMREGHGMSDLLVKTPDGAVHLVECKTPTGRLTPDQVKFFAAWGDVVVVDSMEGAIKWLVGSRRRTGGTA